MSRRCIEKLPHTCGSRDGLQVFQEDGKYTGYCFACGTYVPDPYNDKEEGYVPNVHVKTDEDRQAEIAEIGTYQTVSIPTRKLKLEYLTILVLKLV